LAQPQHLRSGDLAERVALATVGIYLNPHGVLRLADLGSSIGAGPSSAALTGRAEQRSGSATRE
jgi:hypothetical protein